MKNYKHDFIELCLQYSVLRFGDFTLKSGRQSPYFFNAGQFNTGQALLKLGYFYATAIHSAAIEFDQLFGPAYKGIPLVTCTATALAQHYQRDVPISFNRKTAKDHGEGGIMVGAPLQGRILLIDDVITAGTAFRHSLELLIPFGVEIAGLVIAIDRQERGAGKLSTVKELEQEFSIPVVSIINLNDVLSYLEADHEKRHWGNAIREYHQHYGA